jgi:hypothetical protein
MLTFPPEIPQPANAALESSAIEPARVIDLKYIIFSLFGWNSLENLHPLVGD